MTVKITVIIPTYKRTKLLIRCLEAMALQTLPKTDFEVVVVSDGPDLQTARALEAWLPGKDLNLRYLQTAQKEGPAAARNQGWQQAESTLIAFTDDDCIPAATWLEAFLKQYDGEYLLAFTGKTSVPLPDKKTDFALNLSRLEEADFITANCACTKRALQKVSGFDERFKMAWREDSDLEFKFLIKNIRISRVPEALVIHPVREVPWGISLKEQKKGIYDALLFKKYPVLYMEKVYAQIWNYYGIFFLSVLLVFSLNLQFVYATAFCALGLTFLFGQFITRRLQDRHRSVSHVLEMISTSLLIPFISVYWRLYGSVKYRVFFI